MKYVIYTSVATQEFEELHGVARNIIATATARNAEAGITGFLYLEDGAFCQYIEGPKTEVDKLMAVIQSDTRHRDIEIQDEGDLFFRKFSNWSMGFLDEDTEIDYDGFTSGAKDTVEAVKMFAAVRATKKNL